jgi:hypothetical protein
MPADFIGDIKGMIGEGGAGKDRIDNPAIWSRGIGPLWNDVTNTGLDDYAKTRDQLLAGYGASQNRRYFDPSLTNFSAAQQQQALAGLRNQMNDTSGGIAGAQFNQASDANQRAAFAAAAGGGGGPAGVGAQGMVAGQFGEAGAQMAGKGAELRLQEQLANQGEYQKQLGNYQAQNLANQQLELQQAHMRNAMSQYYMSKGMSWSQAQTKAQRDQKIMELNQMMWNADAWAARNEHRKASQKEDIGFVADQMGKLLASGASAGMGDAGLGGGMPQGSRQAMVDQAFNGGGGGGGGGGSDIGDWVDPSSYGGSGYG